jgi:hypothetical protein
LVELHLISFTTYTVSLHIHLSHLHLIHRLTRPSNEPETHRHGLVEFR